MKSVTFVPHPRHLADFLAETRRAEIGYTFLATSAQRDKSLSELEARLTSKLTPLCTWSFGGGAGAAILTDYYRGENTLVYVDSGVSVADLSRDITGLVPDAGAR